MHGLILFDLDGTLYQGDAPFRFYAKTIARHMASEDQHRYLDQVESHLNGRERLVAGDNWEAVVQLAEPYLADDDLWQQAFVETRIFMNGEQCELEVPDALRQLLRELRSKITLACVSNSPPEAAIPLLQRLDLYCLFDQVTPSANKPNGLIQHARELWNGQLVPERTLSVGDNYRNDIAPALEAGFATAHISPRGYFPGPSIARGYALDDVIPFIRSWVTRLSEPQRPAEM
ncbi:HAD family hydrolase [Sulfobacillus harzensis]|uniref:HAD family hydrolase n=1 Tax=Sulfobacillus harzensis TaxID=2729629 RepID=A0A7Y0L4K3_9FIRM|nr:HAD family hydrolase [Sulfobacillus harzensis]NMP23181.1 HAD family hydrolase [Sulfobacillus harzensis]